MADMSVETLPYMRLRSGKIAGGGGGNGAGAFSARPTKLPPRIEVASNGWTAKSWLEAMKASSPTASGAPRPDVFASFSASAAAHEGTMTRAWMEKHPSAIEGFSVVAAAAEGKEIVVFLDYDGTLSPIVNDPDRAFMSEAMRKTVRDVASCFPTAIVSGRCIDKVYNLVRLTELYYAGSHGMDIKAPSSSRDQQVKAAFQPAKEFLPMINEVLMALTERTRSTPGARLENNKFCVSVHFRCVDEKRWSGLAEDVRSVIKGYPKLQVTQGRKVLEIRPAIKWDKGKAIEFLMESLGFASRGDVFPVYIGDDRTDEDAFEVLRQRGQGLGILVSKFPKDTSASYSLKEPAEVMEFLRRLVELRR